MNGWQPIETAPCVEDGSELVIWNGRAVIVTWWDDYGYVDAVEFLSISNATHWMPLPDAPHD